MLYPTELRARLAAAKTSIARSAAERKSPIHAASLAAGHLDGPFDLVLLPHHGGHGEAVGRLLERAAAVRLWISGSGRPPIADELDRRGLVWESTADGALRLELTPRTGAETVGVVD